MKNLAILLAVLLIAGVWPDSVAADPMDELTEQFASEYDALIPPPNSSVGTDYPIRQVALGAFYTNQSLRLLYEQNQSLIDRQQELVEKYDRIIELNERIVVLLTRIAEKSEEPEAPATGGGQ